MSFLISLSHSKSPFSFPFSFPFLFSHCRRFFPHHHHHHRPNHFPLFLSAKQFHHHSKSLHLPSKYHHSKSLHLFPLTVAVWSLAFSGLVARRTTVWLLEWVKASTFLVFLGLCFHSKAFSHCSLSFCGFFFALRVFRRWCPISGGRRGGRRRVNPSERPLCM